MRNLDSPRATALYFKSPACPGSPTPSKGSHLLLLGTDPLSCDILSAPPRTPTQSLSQTISCSFPSDQFLRKDNYPWREEAEHSRSQEHGGKLHRVHSPPARRAFVLNTGHLVMVTPPSQTSASCCHYTTVLTARPRIRGLSTVARLRFGPQHHSVLRDGARTEPVCHQRPRCTVPLACVTPASLVFKLFTCLSPTQNCQPPPTLPCRCVRSRCSEAT